MFSPRRVIAGFGRTLITTGVLLLLFVAYQLWGTGIAHAQRQDKAGGVFEAQLASLDLEPGANLAVDTTVEPAPPSDSVVDSSIATAPSVTTTTLPQVRPGRSQMLPRRPGTVLGKIVIPKIKLTQYVVEGSDKESLKTGPGHYLTTPLPGQPGNSAIACHRTTYGAPCFNLDRLEPGDPIVVQTLQGTYRYIVKESFKVSPKDSSVLNDTPDENLLTLTTCDPKYSAARRLIVRSVLEGPAEESDLYLPVEPEVLATAAADASASENPDTVLAPESGATADSTAAPVTEEQRLPGPTLGDAALTQIDPQGTGPIWSSLWFRGHRSTWLETLGLAATCAVIWLGAWFFARRRSFIAQALIYVPCALLLFGPVLYFCFERIARLLPDSV